MNKYNNYAKIYRQTHKKEAKRYARKYYLAHKEEKKEHHKIYYQTHKDELKQARKNHLKEKKEYDRIYRQAHSLQIKTKSKIYSQTPEGKERNKKHTYKRRRQLGFEPLNEYFEGAIAHHHTDKIVVYMPEKIHLRFSGYNRKEHRRLILQYYGSLKGMIAYAK